MNYAELKSQGVLLSGTGQFRRGVPAIHTSAPGERLLRSALSAGHQPPSAEIVTLSGTALVYEQMSADELRQPRMLFRRGCFSRSLRERADLPLLFDFSSARILGRTKAGTAAIFETVDGLDFEVQPPPGAVWSDDLLVSISRHDITGCACACIPRESFVEMRGKDKVVVVRQADLIAVSVTSFPEFDAGLKISKTASAAAATAMADRAFLGSMGIQMGRI